MMSSVECPISGVRHTIIRSDSPLSVLEDWKNNCLKRLNNGDNLCFAVDCEGKQLGCIHNSLRTLHVAEVMYPGFIDIKNDYWNRSREPIDIKIKPGFIIIFPFTDKIKEIVSSVLGHKNTVTLFYDCTNDHTALLEEGIAINLDKVFDSSTGGGMARLLCDPYRRNATSLSQKAKSVIDNERKILWDDILVDWTIDPNSESTFFNQPEFLKYAASGLARVTIAAAIKIYEGSGDSIKMISKEKISEEKKMRSEWFYMPSIKRQFSFYMPKFRKALMMVDLWDEMPASFKRGEILKCNLRIVQATKREPSHRDGLGIGLNCGFLKMPRIGGGRLDFI